MTMQYNFLTGQYEDDGTIDTSTLDMSGAYSGTPGYVLPDVSRGSPDMSPSTPTGNGTGYYANAQTSSSWTDLAKNALQYALGKDQAKNQAMTQFTQTSQLAAIQNQAAQAKAKQNMFLLLIVAGVVVFMVHEEK